MHAVLLTLVLASPAVIQAESTDRIKAVPMIPKPTPEAGAAVSPRAKPEATERMTPGLTTNSKVDWESECTKYKGVPIPKGDEPTTEMKACSSENLYFGIGIPRNPEQARLCAYQERKTGGPVYGGAGVLAMIYANGIGATRNVDLALRFACEIHGAPAEMEGRIQHLQSFQGNDFDLCQDITSGYMIGFCKDHEKKFADIKRQERLQKVTAGIIGPNKVLLDKLQQASRDFIETRIRNEVDLSGTMRAAMMISEEETLEEDFLQMLERYGQGKPNRYTQQDLRSRDGKMQAALARIAQTKFEFTTVTAEGIAKTQKAWEGYRDAFADFAAKHYAGTPGYSVKAWLTAKRVHMLDAYK